MTAPRTADERDLAALGEFVLVVALLCVALLLALWAMP